MNPLLLDIVEYFKSLGLVLGDGEDCFRDFSPESPDDIVYLIEYNSGEVPFYDDAAHRSVQINVRCSNPDDARLRALELFKALKSDTKYIRFTDTRWGQVTLRQAPIKVKRDENKRTVYAFNIGITTTID